MFKLVLFYSALKLVLFGSFYKKKNTSGYSPLSESPNKFIYRAMAMRSVHYSYDRGHSGLHLGHYSHHFFCASMILFECLSITAVPSPQYYSKVLTGKAIPIH